MSEVKQQAANNGNASSHIDAAFSAAERENWPEVESQLRAAALSHSLDTDTLYLLGIACFHQKKFIEAETCLAQVQVASPNFSPAYFYLAGSCSARDDWSNALRWLEQFVPLEPENPNGWLRLGQLLLAVARYNEATEKLQQSLVLAPNSVESRRLLGHAQFNCGLFSASIDTLSPLIENKQIDIDSLRLLCRAAEELEDFPKALAYATLLHEMHSEDISDKLMLARTRFAAGEEDGGLSAYRDFLTLKGIPPEARKLRSARIVTSETWELLASRWVSLGLPSEGGAGSTIRPSLTRHDQVTVLGSPEWLVITRNDDLLIEQMTHNPKTLRKKSRHIPAISNSRCLLDLPTEEINIVEACALIGGSTNYYQWLVDYLPRVGILNRLPDLHGLHLLVNHDLAPFQRESLTALGISEERLIFLPEGAIAKCRALWVPTLLTRLTALHTFAAGWLRTSYLKPQMKQAPKRRLYVTQFDPGQSCLLNETELIEKLLPLGFEVIRCGPLGFIDLVSTFAAAEIVIGIHGPGLTNIVFSPWKTPIIELGIQQNSATFFSGMAGQLQQQLVRINGKAEPNASPLPHTWNFSIDIEDVIRAIHASLK